MTVTQQAPNPEKTVPPSERFLISERVAAQLCSVSLPTFRKWMQAGVITRVELPEGLKRNLYLRSAVEALAQRLAAAGSSSTAVDDGHAT